MICECACAFVCVKQCDSRSDSDRSAGHVWAAVMDAGGTVISKAFQGRHDSLCVFVCMLALCVCMRMCVCAHASFRLVSAKGDPSQAEAD